MKVPNFFEFFWWFHLFCYFKEYISNLVGGVLAGIKKERVAQKSTPINKYEYYKLNPNHHFPNKLSSNSFVKSTRNWIDIDFGNNIIGKLSTIVFFIVEFFKFLCFIF